VQSQLSGCHKAFHGSVNAEFKCLSRHWERRVRHQHWFIAIYSFSSARERWKRVDE
jgi:hypothetical protein